MKTMRDSRAMVSKWKRVVKQDAVKRYREAKLITPIHIYLTDNQAS